MALTAVPTVHIGNNIEWISSHFVCYILRPRRETTTDKIKTVLGKRCPTVCRIQVHKNVRVLSARAQLTHRKSIWHIKICEIDSCVALGLLFVFSGVAMTRAGINPLNTELNPICHLLALLAAHHIFHVSGLRVKLFYGKQEIKFAA